MQRQRGELVPVAEVIADLPGPVQALRKTSPQARHHFTRFDQVNALVSASEADPELGFMARLLALCSLPRTEGPSPEGDGFGRHKHAQSAEADFRSRPDRRLSAAVLRRFRSLRDLLKASPKGEGFHPSPMGTLTPASNCSTYARMVRTRSSWSRGPKTSCPTVAWPLMLYFNTNMGATP